MWPFGKKEEQPIFGITGTISVFQVEEKNLGQKTCNDFYLKTDFKKLTKKKKKLIKDQRDVLLLKRTEWFKKGWNTAIAYLEDSFYKKPVSEYRLDPRELADAAYSMLNDYEADIYTVVETLPEKVKTKIYTEINKAIQIKIDIKGLCKIIDKIYSTPTILDNGLTWDIVEELEFEEE